MSARGGRGEEPADVLRSAVGDGCYAIIEELAASLDALEARGVIDGDGLASVLDALADAIVGAEVLRGLPGARADNDTHTPEDSAS